MCSTAPTRRPRVQMNMQALNNMRVVEVLCGHTTFFAIYTLAGLAGSVASFAFCPHPAVGASGAIMGVFGALWFTLSQNEERYGKSSKAIQTSILQSLGLTLVVGLVIPMVDNWCAHVLPVAAGL